MTKKQVCAIVVQTLFLYFCHTFYYLIKGKTPEGNKTG